MIHRQIGCEAGKRHPTLTPHEVIAIFGVELRPQGGRRNPQRRPWDKHFRGNPRLIGPEIDASAPLISEQPSLIAIEAAPAQCAHRWMVAQFSARRNEEQGEAPRPGAGINAEFDPIGVGERECPIIGQQVDAEIILSDRRQREAPLAPREIHSPNSTAPSEGDKRGSKLAGFGQPDSK